MDLRRIRATIVAAVASDEILEQTLVLKGGNALELVHRLGSRASVDIDFSMEDDLSDVQEFGSRLLRALIDRFDVLGYFVFDFDFAPRPSTSTPGQVWGGYASEFKLITHERKLQLRSDMEQLRRQAETTGPDQSRRFKIDISKFEMCRGSMSAEVEGWKFRVYTPSMIAAEKLRAICQQMTEYSQRKNPAPRARDFYDIHAVVVGAGVDLTAPEELALLRSVFGAKQVPLALLQELPAYREFHRQDWPKVRNAVGGELLDFDVYYDFTLELVRRILKPGRVVNAPPL